MSDPVNNPPHYTLGGVEVIDAIEAWQLGFRLGNAVKYIARAGKKDQAKTLEDLKKALWYLDREIMALERQRPAQQPCFCCGLDRSQHIGDRCADGNAWSLDIDLVKSTGRP